MRVRLVALATLLFLVGAPVLAAEWTAIDRALAELDQVIGHYPPAITSDKQLRSVTAQYEKTKATLDKAVAARPNDPDALLRRGQLQAMGHNLDVPGAFNGAERDFATILNADPTNERAILDLANMWVNSGPEKAPRAEKLYRAVQCLHDAKPVEEAQRGLFFAFFYQGLIEEAKRQAEFLVAQWPEVKIYRDLDGIAGSALERQGTPRRPDQPPTMVACK